MNENKKIELDSQDLNAIHGGIGMTGEGSPFCAYSGPGTGMYCSSCKGWCVWPGEEFIGQTYDCPYCHAKDTYKGMPMTDFLALLMGKTKG